MQKYEEGLFEKLYNAYHKAKWINGGIKGKVNYAYDVVDNHLVVIFQCTHGVFDWLLNFYFFPKKVVPYKNMEYEFKVHSGFWKEFDSVRDDILEHVKKEMSSNKYDGIYIYGYSLGGALAYFCKEMLEFHLGSVSNIQCVTIGAPRGFCKTKNWEKIKHRFNNCTRYQNGSDIVTTVPPKILGGIFTPFKHVCEVEHVGEKFSLTKIFNFKYHIDTEYYNAIMNIGE